jgi:aminopeptidase N
MSRAKKTTALAIGTMLVGTLAAAARPGEEQRGAWWAEHGYTCAHCRGEAADEANRRARAFDEATGEDRRNFPPHRFVDMRSMVLELAIRDMQQPVLVGRETLSFVPVARTVSTLTLNVGPVQSMVIGEVSLVRGEGAAAEKVNYVRDRDTITMKFDPPLQGGVGVGEAGQPGASGSQATLVIPYVLVDPPDGLTWTPRTQAWGDRPAQIHSQGQAESNHFWFPCHDFPNERLATELVVTVPSGFVVSSNGRLVERQAGWPAWTGSAAFPSMGVLEERTIEVLPWESAEVPDSGKPKPWEGVAGTSYETFRWRLERGHVNYLVSMVVGKFDVVDVGGTLPGGVLGTSTRRMELPVYAPVGMGDRVKRTYGRTLEMISLFEKRFGEPYPWGQRYAQLVVHNFGAGGMENTSATTMYDTAVLDETALLDGDLDGLISHELGHQWFGDLITCNSWEHIWLNEGFATYSTALWNEQRDGREAYDASRWGNLQSLKNVDKAAAPYQAAMVSKEYENPWEAFRREANPYPKGASVLWMLREKLGDAVFFKGIATYVDRFKDKTARTADFRRAMEDVSGLSLQRFFDQWTLRPGVPKVKVETAYDAGQRAVTITLTQTQPIDGWNPAFELDVPLVVGLEDGTVMRPRVVFDTRTASITVGGVAPVAWVNVDPVLTQLVDFEVAQGAAAWVAVLRGDGPLPGRLRAADALGRVGAESAEAPAAAAALVATLRDTGVYFGLRAEAAEALGRLGRAEELMTELARGVGDARVRRSVVQGIVSAKKPEAQVAGAGETAADVLARMAQKDGSYGVRAAAVRGLGTLKVERYVPVVMAALEVESQHDQIRNAALDALADLDRADGLEPALRWTREGVMARTRPTAVRAAAALAKHNPDRVYETLVALLKDREDRTARTAGDALVQIKDPRGVAVLNEYARSRRARGDEAGARAGERWSKALSEKLAASSASGGGAAGGG